MTSTKSILIVVDPKAAILNAFSSLRRAGWDLEEIDFQQANLDIAINRNDLSRVAFALSGSDKGISLADGINHKLGLAGVRDSRVLYNKVSQYGLIKSNFPTSVFDDAKIFDSIETLKAYLLTCTSQIVIRPEVSTINGSAIVYDNNYNCIEKDIQALFASVNKVITHPFVEGASYFINGMLINHMLYATDVWRCFNLMDNNRYILTSVINLSLQDDLVKRIMPTLQKMSEKLCLKNSPIHFEIVMEGETLKIVKIVPRVATEPLPTLCNLAGMKSQAEIFCDALSSSFGTLPSRIQAPTYFVADYSFIVRKAGYLNSMKIMSLVTSLPSYRYSYYLPAKGSFLPRTQCGATYGATVLLAHQNRSVLISDIETCQEINRKSLFSILPRTSQ